MPLSSNASSRPSGENASSDGAGDPDTGQHSGTLTARRKTLRRDPPVIVTVEMPVFVA